MHYVVKSRINTKIALESRDDPWPDPLSCFTLNSSIFRCKIAWLCSCATSSPPRWEACCPKPWSCVPVLQRRWRSWIPRVEPCLETGFLARVSQVPFYISTPTVYWIVGVCKFNDTTVCFRVVCLNALRTFIKAATLESHRFEWLI